MSSVTKLPSLAMYAARRLPQPVIKWLGRLQFRGTLLRKLTYSMSQSLVSRDLIIKRGQGAGLAFNAANTFPGYVLGTTEPLVQQALVGLCPRDGVVYDIGANVGFFSVIAARGVGPKGRIIAFEPVEECTRAIAHNASLNGYDNIVVVPCALGSRRAQMDFFVGANTTQSRLNPPADAHGRWVKLQVEALDDLVSEQGLPRPDVIKMDIEGAEIEALRGMQATIAQHRPVLLCEMHGRTREFMEIMDEHGYDVEAIEPVATLESAPWWIHLVATPRAVVGT